MKIILLIAAFIILGLGVGSYIGFDIGFEKAVKEKGSTKEKVNASFAIFTNGALRDFTNPRYHNQSKDVFIQSDNPNIIYVKKKGITWNDFFKTLPMQLSKDCLITGTGQKFCTNEDGSLKFYLNGQRDDNVLSKEIKNGDQALITYGNESEEEIKEQFQKIPKAQNLVSFIFYGII